MKTKINCLDVNITNTITTNLNSKFTAKKPLPTYISNQHRASTLTSSIFKGFLHRVLSIYSEKYIEEEKKNFNRYVRSE